MVEERMHSGSTFSLLKLRADLPSGSMRFQVAVHGERAVRWSGFAGPDPSIFAAGLPQQSISHDSVLAVARALALVAGVGRASACASPFATGGLLGVEGDLLAAAIPPEVVRGRTAGGFRVRTSLACRIDTDGHSGLSTTEIAMEFSTTGELLGWSIGDWHHLPSR